MNTKNEYESLFFNFQINLIRNRVPPFEFKINSEINDTLMETAWQKLEHV
jgi:hypothetical protein